MSCRAHNPTTTKCPTHQHHPGVEVNPFHHVLGNWECSPFFFLAPSCITLQLLCFHGCGPCMPAPPQFSSTRDKHAFGPKATSQHPLFANGRERMRLGSNNSFTSIALKQIAREGWSLSIISIILISSNSDCSILKLCSICWILLYLFRL